MANSNLPLDTMLEIFSRLPTKSVDRCKCLSKTWRTHFSSTSFINLHLNHQRKRHICVSFLLSGWSQEGPFDSYVKSIELSKLFSSEHYDDIESVSHDVRPTWSETYEQHTGIGMVVATDGSLYVASNECQQHPTSPQQSLKLFKHCFFNHQFQQVDDVCHSKFTTCKPFPVLVEIKQRIYALSAPQYHHAYDLVSIDNPFEVYDPTHQVWKTLDPPPFMMRYNKDDPLSREQYYGIFPTDCIWVYVVVGKFLCVSLSLMSFAFDTESEKWDRCDLFSKLYASGIPLGSSIEFDYSYYLDCVVLCRRLGVGARAGDEIGAPFPGVFACLEYDGYMLCLMSPYGYNVVAFKIVNGHLEEEPQILLELKIQKYSYDSYFVGLGGGELCLVALCDNVLTFTKFKVVKKIGGLICENADVKFSTLCLTKNPHLTDVSCYGAVAH